MSRVSCMGISSPQGLKKTPKISPREARFYFPRANFKVFFNPQDEEISIPETHDPFGNYIPVRVNQAILCINLTSFFKNIALIKNFVK